MKSLLCLLFNHDLFYIITDWTKDIDEYECLRCNKTVYLSRK